MDEKDKKIARLEELLQSIKDNIDETESVLDSLSNSELQAENDNDLPDDEFDRLLDEFIQSQLSEEETEDEEESDNSPSNTSHHIIFKNTFFSICDTKEQIPRDSLRTQFSVDEGEYLFISTECIGQNESATIDAWDETFLAELIAPDGSSYIETQISMPTLRQRRIYNQKRDFYIFAPEIRRMFRGKQLSIVQKRKHRSRPRPSYHLLHKYKPEYT